MTAAVGIAVPRTHRRDMPDDDNVATEPLTGADAENGSDRDPESRSESKPDPDLSPSNRVKRLEAEGDAAADFLEELLDIVDLDGDIDLDVEGDRATVSVVGADLQQLVGPDGQVLDALQELTRLAVLQETGERSRLMLDVSGHRARRRAELEQVAAEAIERVNGNREPVRMAPMNPFERKVVHDAVAAAGLSSESEGDEPNRRVVVLPGA